MEKIWEKNGTGAMIRSVNPFLFFMSLLLILIFPTACSNKAKISYLLRDIENPPRVIQDTFSARGKSDYILTDDAGYPYRLIYLCENRVYNFTEEPAKNFLLISFQSILETPVEQILSPDDRRRIWACMERTVWEEQSRINDLRRRVTEDRSRLESELQSARSERDRLFAASEEKKQAEAEKQRRNEAEARRFEEERQRKIEEDLRRQAEEERKIKFYKAGERDREEPPIIPPTLKATETGIFLVMKETNIFEEPRSDSKILGQGKKYDIFDVLTTRRDNRGGVWHRVVMKDRIISTKGKRSGWTPEERGFWLKNKLLAWIYPGDAAKINSTKPIKLDVDDIQYTGKKIVSPDKNAYYEVIYEVNLEFTERVVGWIEEKNGIRRMDKNADEMRALLKDLAYTLWPLSIQTEVLRGQIEAGFTPEQVTLSWGKPDHVNKTRTLVGVHEQWVYGESPFPNTYVYFENGQVQSWEFLQSNTKQ